MHIGERLIDPSELSRLYYDGSGLRAMWLPVAKDKNGRTMPNFSLIKEFSDIMKKGRTENLSHE